MALSCMTISRRQSAIFTSYVKCVQGLLTTKTPLQRKATSKQKSSQASQDVFSPLHPRELAPSKRYLLAGAKYLPGSDGKGFPEFLAAPRQGLPQAYKIEHSDQFSIGEWAEHCRKLLNEELTKYGAVLFRGLPLYDDEHFALFASSLGYTPMGYEGGTADRPTIDKKAKVFLSSFEPKENNIEPHNEMAYWPFYPQKVIFHSNIPPAEGCGGLTPITKNTEVQEQLDPKVVQKFEEKQIRYIRTLPCEGKGTVYTWEYTFQTEDRKKVEEYLEDSKFFYKWNEDDSLFYWCNLPATIHHPLTKEKIWFNQAHAHHATYLKCSPMYEGIVYDSDSQYPTHTTYGDGTEIEPEVLQHIRNVSWNCTVGFEWKKGDTLILDNLQAMHGRICYTGERRIMAYLTSD